MNEAEAEEMTARIRQETGEAVRFAKESPFPPVEHLHRDVYPGVS